MYVCMYVVLGQTKAIKQTFVVCSMTHGARAGSPSLGRGILRPCVGTMSLLGADRPLRKGCLRWVQTRHHDSWGCAFFFSTTTKKYFHQENKPVSQIAKGGAIARSVPFRRHLFCVQQFPFCPEVDRRASFRLRVCTCTLSATKSPPSPPSELFGGSSCKINLFSAGCLPLCRLQRYILQPCQNCVYAALRLWAAPTTVNLTLLLFPGSTTAPAVFMCS